MNFTLVELAKISLGPGEVLSVKLYGDDYDEASVASLREHMEKLFPNNKILMFVLPVGHDLQMEKISGTLENSEVKKLVDTLNDCSSPVSFCDDCSCGKKAMAEAKDESQRESPGDLQGTAGTTDDSDKL